MSKRFDVDRLDRSVRQILEVLRIKPFESRFTVAEAVFDKVVGNIVRKRDRFGNDFGQCYADIDELHARQRLPGRR